MIVARHCLSRAATSRPATSSSFPPLAAAARPAERLPFMSSMHNSFPDRKAMEAARLARVAQKRAAALSDDLPAQSPKKAKRSVSPPPLRSADKASAPCTEFVSGTGSVAANPSPSALQYPEGRLFKTWALGYERNGHDIKIEQVLRRRELNIAVLSSWQIDMEWLMSKLDTDRTKIIMVYGEKNVLEQETHRESLKEAGWGKSLRVVFPPMGNGQYDCMHSKLMLLFYKDSLRVAVPSANLLPFDWGETGDMENSVYVIDLPRLAENRQGHANSSLQMPFARELGKYVDAMEMDKGVADPRQTVREGLKKFDFSKTAHVRFVHTIGRTFVGANDIKTTGLNQLAQSVREMGLATNPGDPLQVDYSASSIGALTTDKLDALFKALRGIDQTVPSAIRGTAAASRGQQKLKFASSPAPDDAGEKEIIPLDLRFRVHYPSTDYVINSKGGPGSAGTQFMTKSWNKEDKKEKFPFEVLHDFSSKRRGCMSHNKFIVARTATSAFVYSGSANFSQHAWGTLTYDRKAKQPKLACPNWECGVLLKVWPLDEAISGEGPDPDDVSTASEAETDDGNEGLAARTKAAGAAKSAVAAYVGVDNDGVVPVSIFDGKLDIPYNIPDRSYKDNDLEPWMQ